MPTFCSTSDGPFASVTEIKPAAPHVTRIGITVIDLPSHQFLLVLLRVVGYLSVWLKSAIRSPAQTNVQSIVSNWLRFPTQLGFAAKLTSVSALDLV
jgi:hypothetical protein